jgi:hypothetical protein
MELVPYEHLDRGAGSGIMDASTETRLDVVFTETSEQYLHEWYRGVFQPTTLEDRK